MAELKELLVKIEQKETEKNYDRVLASSRVNDIRKTLQDDVKRYVHYEEYW